MNRQEFKTWLNEHARLYPEVHKYLSDADSGELRRQSWYDTLGKYSLAELRQATQLLHGGVEPQPYGAAGHASVLAVHAAVVRPPVVDAKLQAELERSRRFKQLRAEGLSWSQCCAVVDENKTIDEARASEVQHA